MIHTSITLAAILYIAITLFRLPVPGQTPSPSPDSWAAMNAANAAAAATTAAHGQQLADLNRRMEQVDKMALGERLARIELQLESVNRANYGALTGILVLLGETVLRLLGGKLRRRGDRGDKGDAANV